NLSEGGRAQATEIGSRLRASGIAQAHVFSSQWCRCVHTAELLGLGAVEELPFLNSLVNYRREGSAMIRETRAWILEQDLSTPTILVTHQINIGALLRRYPAEGEIVVVRPTPSGGLDVVGTISAPFVD
ncbi:MAG: histidine phosphatase family protein, partial [Gammaproteobacteria bacterium]|nr:histidine phosphatase family protein [Gammaproteobacteria bacterium]